MACVLAAATLLAGAAALADGSAAAPLPAQCNLNSGGYFGAGQAKETYPVARYTWTPLQPAAGKAASFDASASGDADGDPIIAYLWNFGDGAVVGTSTPKVRHTFAGVGTYSVTLQILDCRDFPGQVTAPIKVGLTAIAGTGGTRGICLSRRTVAITLPHANGTKVLSALVTSQGRTLRSLKAAALSGRTLSISFFGLPKVPVTVRLRSRSGGHIVTRRIVFHPCTRGRMR